MLSCISGVQFLATLRTVALGAPLSKGFSRQEYWSGLPCPPPGDLPHSGIKPMSPAALELQAKNFFLLWSHHGRLDTTLQVAQNLVYFIGTFFL